MPEAKGHVSGPAREVYHRIEAAIDKVFDRACDILGEGWEATLSSTPFRPEDPMWNLIEAELAGEDWETGYRAQLDRDQQAKRVAEAVEAEKHKRELELKERLEYVLLHKKYGGKT